MWSGLVRRLAERREDPAHALGVADVGYLVTDRNRHLFIAFEVAAFLDTVESHQTSALTGSEGLNWDGTSEGPDPYAVAPDDLRLPAVRARVADWLRDVIDEIMAGVDDDWARQVVDEELAAADARVDPGGHRPADRRTVHGAGGLAGRYPRARPRRGRCSGELNLVASRTRGGRGRCRPRRCAAPRARRGVRHERGVPLAGPRTTPRVDPRGGRGRRRRRRRRLAVTETLRPGPVNPRAEDSTSSGHLGARKAAGQSRYGYPTAPTGGRLAT